MRFTVARPWAVFAPLGLCFGFNVQRVLSF